MVKRKVPNIVRGGAAIPLGRNYYYMTGRKHEQGGIDVGRNPRTGIEVEDGEVVHIGNNEIKVFSAQPFLNGRSPAQRVMRGENPNAVFNAQERYKKRNKLNDDGTKRKRMGGLSRDKDYGSKSKPYPNVKSKDFAGKGRSYPIPTKADAVDALRLAGLHGRDDVKAKVYAKYPDLRRKARNGGLYSVTVDGKTILKQFPKRKKAVLGTDDDYNKRNISDDIYVLGPHAWDRVVYTNDNVGNKLLWSLPKVPTSNNYPFPWHLNSDYSTGESASKASGASTTAPAVKANNEVKSAALARRGDTPRRYSSLSIPDAPSEGISVNNVTPTITPNIPSLNIAPIEIGDSSIGDSEYNIFDKDNFFSKLGKNGFFKEMFPAIGGAIANGIGNRRSYNANKEFINSLRYSPAPIQRNAAKLKTRINIAPQLDKMRESLAAYERAIDNNTSNSQVALARKRAARMANVLQTNELYGTKENAETELINKDRLNQQIVANANIESYNTWRDGKAAFENAVSEKRAENEVSRINNNVGIVQNVFDQMSRNRNLRNTIIAQMAASPNVNPELLRDLGADWVTDDMIERYKKANKKK